VDVLFTRASPSSGTVSVIWERAFLPTVDRSHSLDRLVRKRTQIKAQNENVGGRMVEKVALASGAALVALAGNNVAEAGIVASQNLPLRPSTARFTDVFWDVDGDSQAEFNLFHGYTNFVTYTYAGNPTYVPVDFAFLRFLAANPVGVSYSLAKLSAGAEVGPDATFAVSYGTRMTSGGDIAVAGWQMGETGFFGFSFQSNGQTVYAWAELALDPTSANTAGYGFQILRAYYDDTGAPIIVGNTGGGGSPVPEPSTYALALLAAGGVAAYRSRRKTVAA
jgi:hypothetical protein